MAKLDTLNQNQETTNERLTKLETANEQLTTEQPLLQLYTRRDFQNNAQDHDDRYLKSIRLVPTLDGCLDPELFLKWL